MRVGGEKGPLSIAISLQKDQTIALLLRKYNAVGNTVHSHYNSKNATASTNIKATFGAVNNCLGEIVRESGVNA